MVLTSSAALMQRPRLTDTQLVALSAASQHAHGLIQIPSRLLGAAGLAFGRKLVTLGIAAERPAEPGELWWRRDADGDLRFALFITAMGLAALGIDQNPCAEPGELEDRSLPDIDGVEAAREAPRNQPAARSRDGSKRVRLIASLSAPDGASVNEMASSLGWLPHTTRAALTGLRHAGYALQSWKPRSVDGTPVATRYRLAPSSAGEPIQLSGDASSEPSAVAKPLTDRGAA